MYSKDCYNWNTNPIYPMGTFILTRGYRRYLLIWTIIKMFAIDESTHIILHPYNSICSVYHKIGHSVDWRTTVYDKLSKNSACVYQLSCKTSLHQLSYTQLISVSLNERTSLWKTQAKQLTSSCRAPFSHKVLNIITGLELNPGPCNLWRLDNCAVSI